MRRILLVDDSESTRRLLMARVVERGFEIESAPEATSAAELAMARPPDAVVTDLWMPGIAVPMASYEIPVSPYYGFRTVVRMRP